MFNVSDQIRNIIFYSGVALLIIGGSLAYWALQRFDTLPNYQRLAVLVPVLLSFAMLRVDLYRNWSSVQGIERGRALGVLLAPPLLLVGSLVWWLVAPDARA